LETRTEQFCDRLNGDFKQRGWPLEITRTASIFWLHQATEQPIRRIEQIPRTNAAAFAKVFHGALDRGVYLSPSGYEVNFMSLAHSDDLLERAHAAILESVERAHS